MLSQEERDALDRMQLAHRDAQQDLKARLSTPEQLQRALDGGWGARVDAITMLGYLGRDDEVLRLALAEREAEGVTDHALRLLLPTPPLALQPRPALLAVDPGLLPLAAARRPAVRRILRRSRPAVA